MADPRLVDHIWYGRGDGARAARALLTPLEKIYAGVTGVRDILYDAGWLRSRALPAPAISVGNLTVGGTGKTPVASWIAAQLLARGARPAILLRGYGGDEAEVHRVLLPDAPVFVDADRLQGAARAVAAGADVLVLDDAFQHRRARRTLDLVLLSADRWSGDTRLLPAGPWREPLSAVQRAHVVIVTRKAASDSTVGEVHAQLSRIAPNVPRVSIRLEPDELVSLGGHARRPLATLAGAHARVLLTIGDPRAFIAQLEARGARVTATIYGDHHALTPGEIEQFASTVGPMDIALCTLKDAVKVQDQWPRRATALWYVSQRVVVERGVGGIEKALDDVLRQRLHPSHTSG